MAEINTEIQRKLADFKEKYESREIRYFYFPLYQDTLIEPPLFKLEKDGTVFYLLGTYHWIPIGIFPQPMQEIIGNCKNIILENHGHSGLTEEHYIKMGIFAKEPTDKNWFLKLSLESREILENALNIFCEKFKLEIPMERVVPELAYFVCHGAACRGGMEDSLEKLFTSRIFVLEDTDNGIEHFERFTIEKLDDCLKNCFGFLKKSPTYDADNLSFDKHYLDSSILYAKEFFEHESNRPENYKRTQIWLPKLRLYFRELTAPSLIAVGLAHLVAKNGLLYLLEQEGFKISRINRYGFSVPFSAKEIYDSPEVARSLFTQWEKFKIEVGDKLSTIKMGHVRFHPLPDESLLHARLQICNLFKPKMV